jgi:hypothetical protein
MSQYTSIIAFAKLAARRNRAQKIKSRQPSGLAATFPTFVCYLDTAMNSSDFNSAWNR